MDLLKVALSLSYADEYKYRIVNFFDVYLRMYDEFPPKVAFIAHNEREAGLFRDVVIDYLKERQIPITRCWVHEVCYGEDRHVYFYSVEDVVDIDECISINCDVKGCPRLNILRYNGNTFC